MSKAKIVIETTTHKKKILQKILDRHHQTLKGWFLDQLELFSEPDDLIKPLQIEGINSPKELENSQKVIDDLSSINWSFLDDETGYLTHNIHPYPAKFIPQIPAHLIARLSLPGESVLDPFHGSGTTAVEALRLGRKAICIDANPISEFIGKAKTSYYDNEIEKAINNLIKYISRLITRIDASDDVLLSEQCDITPNIPNMLHWFSPIAIIELTLIKKAIDNILSTKASAIALTALSKVIFKVSYQDGETRYARREKQIKQSETLGLFLIEIEGIIKRLKKANSVFRHNGAQFITLDSRSIPESILPDNSVDLLVTSPPYPNVTDYHLYHRFRIFWLGCDPLAFSRQEIGSHLKHQRENTGFENYISDMHICMSRFFSAIRPGRYAVFIVGDGVYKGKIYKTSEALALTAKDIGFEVCGDISRSIHDTRRSFVKPARRAQSEHILVLRKPPKNMIICISPPKYRMWDYEKFLRIREVETKAGKNINFDSPDAELRINVDSYKIPELRMLTFSHSVRGESWASFPTWQTILENGNESNGKRKEPKYATHGIHGYKGKFYPQLAKALINISGVPCGSIMLDPFSGSGTAILEAYLNGMKGVGCDMHPLAVKIANAKSGILAMDPAKCEREIVNLLNKIKLKKREFSKHTDQFKDEILDEMFSWFPKPVVFKLNWLLNLIRSSDTNLLREFYEVILSSIIRDISFQDPKDLRIRRRKDLLEDAPVLESFYSRLENQLERVRDYWKISQICPVKQFSPKVILGDSRDESTFNKLNLKHGDVDLIVTSPPYATALPYIDTDRLSLLVLFGMKPNERRVIEQTLTGSREITVREKKDYEDCLFSKAGIELLPESVLDLTNNIYKLNNNSSAGFRRLNMPALLLRYFKDMNDIFSNIIKFMSPAGEIFLVIGDNQTKAGGKIINIPTTKLLIDILEKCGFKIVEQIPITVTTENLRHISNAIKENTILRFNLA